MVNTIIHFSFFLTDPVPFYISWCLDLSYLVFSLHCSNTECLTHLPILSILTRTVSFYAFRASRSIRRRNAFSRVTAVFADWERLVQIGGGFRSVSGLAGSLVNRVSSFSWSFNVLHGALVSPFGGSHERVC